ncbi:MFS transporter [Rhizobium leguminosarum]|uniref:MFS transporter n=1 Tax=Rhizobium TaxID=379 RepID=UPI00102F8775|nr:MFS transporter [Rhizobium leguminosarum]TBF87469.1 MFS transporter [Rhizobium leguminosarum]TBG07020.1 MFS transporter [Rhizobium leguminosarum]TBG07334.1 MFS transporter [Rhizobium leguminosarum]TBG30711.1 MFS transporter [Rhizobium leguminosarum]TBG49704.1 MFS transporter [Rhizobium leguminosarum]
MTDAIGRTPTLSETAPAAVTTVIEGRLTRAQKKAVVAATLGTIVEYTDWVIYATFASILAREYFPAGDSLTSLLSVFAVFAVGFVMRPVGGAVLGAFADRYGRKAGLTISILLMSVASLIIGLCPGYETIGIAAPIILVFSRLIQGFSAGGEFGSASTFLVESAPADRRAFAGSWQWFAINAGTLVSFLLGYALAVLGNDSGLTDWGWRVAFVVAALLGLITLWIRLSVGETEVFKSRVAAEGRPKSPVKDVLFKHRGDALRVIGIAMAGNLLNYVWMVSYPNYIHLVTDMPVRDTLLVGVISVSISLLIIPFAGMLADRIGRKPVLLAFALAAAAWAWPSFALLQPGISITQATALMTIAMIIMTGFAGAGAAMMAEQFPARVRVTGVALPYALSVTLFGGTAPYITTAMKGWGYGSYIWIYLAMICLIAAVVYARLPETKGKALR